MTNQTQPPSGDNYDMSGDFRYATINIKSTLTGQEIHIPFQRPPRAAHFTNRKSELKQLLKNLQPGQVTTLCGPGGIGKSALAAEAIWRLTAQNRPPEQFPDGIIFHSFYNQPQAALAMENIALAFGEETRPTPRDAAQRALAGKQALLLLDGTEDADNLPAVLSVAGSCGVLVTSRKRQDATAQRQDIEPLETAEAIELLQAWGQEWASDTATVGQLCELVDGLPLAVRLVGRYLKQTDEAALVYLEWLQTTPIQALTQGEHKEDSIALLLKRSLKQVSQEAATVLAVVGRLALASFGLEPIAAALALETRPTRNLLNELISYGLILKETPPFSQTPTPYPLSLTELGPTPYSVSHALVHTYAKKRLTVTAKIMAQLVEYYTELAKAESKKGPEGYRRLDTERGHILRVLVGCVEREDWVGTQGLVRSVNEYLDMQGYWTERVTVLEMGIEAAQQAGNHYNEGAFLNSLGAAYWSMGHVEKAIEYFEKSLANQREDNDREGEGIALGNLGTAYRNLGQVEKAIEYHEQALTINREIGHRRGEGAVLGNLGGDYRNLGQIEKAIEYYKKALIIDREIGRRQGEGIRLGNLGNAYRDSGQVEKAIEYHEQALTISREIGDRRNEGLWLGNLGGAYRNLGQIEKAIEYYKKALTISREISDRRNEGVWLGNLGSTYHNLGQVEKAIEYHEQALTISRETGDRRGEGIWLGNLTDAYRKLNQPEQALKYAQKGLLIARQIKARSSEAWRLWEMGQVYQSLGDVAQARDYGQQSVAIFEALKFPQADEVRAWLAGIVE